MKLTTHQRDRAIGAILASATGDALGAPYEFQPPIAASEPVVMQGGGSFGWELGEWSDDTAMAVAILRPLAKGASLDEEQTLDSIVQAWVEWAKTAKDVGMQTSMILRGGRVSSAADAWQVSKELHERSGRTAGNGSLMRTGPVGIATLHSAEQTAENARKIGELTHWDPLAGDACVLWCLAIREAVLNDNLDIRVGIEHLPAERQQQWLELIEEAEANQPAYFSHNGWVIHAFQAAWSAIYLAVSAPSSQAPLEAHRLRIGLENAVRAGYDTDTVAAIAGSLLGAKYGYTAIPRVWARQLHGWPGLGTQELVTLATLALNGGAPGPKGWPGVKHFDHSMWPDRFELAQHPHDPGLWLGGVGSIENLPEEVDAVVSLCRVGTEDMPDHVVHNIQVMLMDEESADANLNTAFIIEDVAATIKELRDQDHTVFLHCVQSQSRTPTVAIAYSMLQLGYSLEEAREAVQQALPYAYPNRTFARILQELADDAEH